MTLTTKDEIRLRKAEILSRVAIALPDGRHKWELIDKIEKMLREV